ncbi:hypothetical protein GOV07_03700 [Candidatus Woesearchaeota archaeon]|nr:hypothetical protein [Candidatus Woesearchaeota archaeon]
MGMNTNSPTYYASEIVRMLRQRGSEFDNSDLGGRFAYRESEWVNTNCEAFEVEYLMRDDWSKLSITVYERNTSDSTKFVENHDGIVFFGSELEGVCDRFESSSDSGRIEGFVIAKKMIEDDSIQSRYADALKEIHHTIKRNELVR